MRTVSRPVQVSGLTGVVAIAAGAAASSALRGDGTVWSWGDNSSGQLGNGTSPGSSVPVQVSGLTAIAAGETHCLALRSDGTVWSWGGGGAGELGDGSNLDSNVPVQVTGLAAAVAVAAGSAYSIVIVAGGLPELTVTPLSLSFTGNGTQTITLTNTGAAPLTIANISIIGPNPGAFSTSGACLEAPLPVGESCALVVAFSAGVNGPSSAALQVFTKATGSPRLILVSGPAAPLLSIAAGGVVNAASYVAQVAPGSIAAVFGNFLTGSPVGLSIQLGGTIGAPLSFATATQANIQIPWELTGQSQTTITAMLNGQSSFAQTVTLAPYAPGIFTTNGHGTGQGAIVDANYRLIDAANPATGGSVLQIFCSGLGPVTNQPATGDAAASSPLSETITLPTVAVGLQPASVLFAGLAPGFIGLYQVNAVVMPGSPEGSVIPVFLSIGGVNANVVTIGVQ